MELKFDENGLIPAIVQDHYTGRVLTLAYMNEESYNITLTEGYTCFWSRSRSELWRKGETSGNRQKVVSITADCDNDALVIDVIKEGPACHTGAESCFFNEMCRFDVDEGADDAGAWQKDDFSYEQLYELIKGRKTDPKDGSYTTYLFQEGMEKILKKIGEESTEVIIAAGKGDKKETIYEVADLCYHVMTMMVESGIRIEDITDELATRHVIDKKQKQVYMG